MKATDFFVRYDRRRERWQVTPVGWVVAALAMMVALAAAVGFVRAIHHPIDHLKMVDAPDSVPDPIAAIPASGPVTTRRPISWVVEAETLDVAIGGGSPQPALFHAADEVEAMVIEVLTGHGEPKEGAREVLVTDAMGYVWRHVPESPRAEHNEDQQPDFRLSGEFPIALLLGGKGLSKGQPAPDPLEGTDDAETTKVYPQVDTGGGGFIGRDKIVHGDEVHGDKVGGDKITVGDISVSTGVAIGSDARAAVTQGLSAEGIASLFANIYRQIKDRTEDPNVDKEELTDTVRKIEQETAKGEQANPSKVERWLKTLALMASDIFDLTVACLTRVVSLMLAQRAAKWRRKREGKRNSVDSTQVRLMRTATEQEVTPHLAVRQ